MTQGTAETCGRYEQTQAPLPALPHLQGLLTATLTGTGTGTLLTFPGALRGGTSVGDGIEQVIVTANRRARNPQTVPTSMSAVTAEDIKSLGVISTTDIAQYVAGAQLMAVNSNTDNRFSIQGATQNDHAEHDKSRDPRAPR